MHTYGGRTPADPHLPRYKGYAWPFDAFMVIVQMHTTTADRVL